MFDQLGDDALYVRFDQPPPTVHVGRRRRYPDFWQEEFSMTPDEWERLLGLGDQWRARV